MKGGKDVFHDGGRKTKSVKGPFILEDQQQQLIRKIGGPAQ